MFGSQELQQVQGRWGWRSTTVGDEAERPGHDHEAQQRISDGSCLGQIDFGVACGCRCSCEAEHAFRQHTHQWCCSCGYGPFETPATSDHQSSGGVGLHSKQKTNS